MRDKKRYEFEQLEYHLGGSIEVEMHRTGPPPRRGKRKKRMKPTPEQMAQQNQYNRVKYVRRLIKANFAENDIWATATYLAGNRKSLRDAVKDRAKFLSFVRKEYRARGYDLKWIGRTERGKRGAVHHHLIINRLPDCDMILAAAWRRVEGAGRITHELLYERGQFADLAAYLVKPSKPAERQNETGTEEERQSSLSHSRGNLVVPVPEVSKTTRKKIISPPEPRKGYYIDRDSIFQGINPITGREYLHYTEIRIRPRGGGT